MIEVTAKVDGQILVPETPLALENGQRVRITIEPIEPATAPVDPAKTGFHEWIGLAGKHGPLNPNPRFPTHDSLWEKD